MKIVSACPLGIRCNWKADESYLNQKAVRLAGSEPLVPVCPGATQQAYHAKKPAL